MNFREFASERAPLRASSLPSFVACPFGLQLSMQEPMDGNAAAQTGSLIHLGVEAFHKLDSIDAAMAVMASERRYPLADKRKAAHFFRRYTEIQEGWGEVVRVEWKVKAILPPHESDPTQEEIVIPGTLDQIRKRGTGFVVCDIKTGAKQIGHMRNYYAPQLLAYQLAVQQSGLYSPVEVAIIRTADFLYGGDIFHIAPYTRATADRIFGTIRLFVSQVRRGERIITPGAHCDWCPAQRVENCTQDKPAIVSLGFRDDIRSIGDLW